MPPAWIPSPRCGWSERPRSGGAGFARVDSAAAPVGKPVSTTRRVLDNILQNALSFAPGEEVSIALEPSGSSCIVSICDRGPGIPEAHLERIFDRFFTYRPSGPSRQEHAGLGLAIARTIVEGYGGTIAARNRPGGGACFDVKLPLARAGARPRAVRLGT